MAYSTEPPRDIGLEDTRVSNLFILDILPDIPDGDFVKVYLYASLCARENLYLTHTELAGRIGLPVEKVLAAWRYFESRRIVRRRPKTEGDETLFDVEFLDIRGMRYASQSGPSAASQAEAGGVLKDEELRVLFNDIATLTGAPKLSGDDVLKIGSWISEWGATPAVILGAFRYGQSAKGVTRTNYIGRIVREWAEKGLRTEEDVAEALAETDARYGVYKQLMEALGLRYKSVTEAEKQKFDLWLDVYGYTPDELLEKAKNKTAGAGNALRYLEGILRKEQEKKAGGDPAAAGGASSGLAGRNEYYRRIREKNRREADAHLEEVYGAAPKIEEVDDALLALNLEKMRLVTSNARDKERLYARLEGEIDEKTAERVRLLELAGFAADYTDVKYDCGKCEDTGIVLGTGASCDCQAAPDSRVLEP
ncbi:MAG: DnaD domain protein [Clostridiales bacterium]|nr:DnaD domain protein [Clostridiales bacterium]